MKKIKYFGIISVAVLGIGGAGFFAYASSEKNTATNVVTVGKVSIALHNTDDKSVSPDEETTGRTISAGEAVKKEVKIENTGNYAAYIRVKMKKEWISAKDGFAYTDLDGDAICPDYKSDWVEGPGEDPDYTYYYYQQILPAAATVSFMDTYHISASKLDMNLLKDYHKQDISITGQIRVQAEAVQADYISDELLEMENGKIVGWNKEEVSFENFVESNATPIPPSDSSSDEAGVDFVGGTDEFVNFKDGNSDLFLSTKGMLPGQEVSQNIQISNTSKNLLDVYLQAKLPEGDYNKELLENLFIVVEKEGTGEIVYQGTLLNHAASDEETNVGDEIYLGRFEVGATESLKVSIKLNPKWKVDSCETKILWTFFHKEVLVKTPAPTQEPTPEPTQEPTPEPVVTKAPTVEPTETPVVVPGPTNEPLVVPVGTEEPKATDVPTAEPTPKPKITATPGFGPLDSPEAVPTLEPTATPKASKVTHDKVDPKPNVPVERATKTGDSTPIIFWIAMAVISFAGCVISGRKIITTRR